MGWKAILAVVLVLMAALPSQACYSGLTITPTAETVGEGCYGIEAQVDGPVDPLRGDTRILNTEIGIGPALEAGADFDLSQDAPTTLLLNAKWLASQGGDGRPALALGVCNLGRHVTASPYAVATQEFPALRAHAGLIGIERDPHWFVGLDTEFGNGLILMADHTQGAGNYSSLGAGWELGGPWSMMAGLQFPNTTADDTLFTLHLVIAGPYRSTQGGA